MNGDTVHSIACDYVTATVHEDRSYNSLHSYASQLFRVEREKGNDAKPWSGSGFKGWKCGSVQISTRDKECMVRIESDVAALCWRRIVELADNISRFDVQVTLKVESGVTQRLDQHLAEASAHSAKHGYKPVVRWIREVKGGYTLYLGARESLSFGRAYDKWHKTQLDYYTGCVRYEVQYQRKLAHLVARSCAQVDSPIPRFAFLVSRFFQDRAIALELPENDPATYCCSRRRSDADRKLEWLRSAVRPSVLSLIALGRGEDAFRALGLITDDGDDLDQLVQVKSN